MRTTEPKGKEKQRETYSVRYLYYSGVFVINFDSDTARICVAFFEAGAILILQKTQYLLNKIRALNLYKNIYTKVIFFKYKINNLI